MQEIGHSAFACAAASSLAGFQTFCKIHSKDRPNIILITVDDMGWKDLGCMGSLFYETPHIDRLAEEGIVFTNAYAPAANCAPSRAGCLTGQYTPRHGIYTVKSSERGESRTRKLIPVANKTVLDDRQRTIAEDLKELGYATAHVENGISGKILKSKGLM